MISGWKGESAVWCYWAEHWFDVAISLSSRKTNADSWNHPSVTQSKLLSRAGRSGCSSSNHERDQRIPVKLNFVTCNDHWSTLLTTSRIEYRLLHRQLSLMSHCKWILRINKLYYSSHVAKTSVCRILFLWDRSALFIYFEEQLESMLRAVSVRYICTRVYWDI